MVVRWAIFYFWCICAAQVAGSFEGMLGRTIRDVTPDAPVLSMEEQYADTTWVWDESENEKIRYSATLEHELSDKYETSGLLEHDAKLNRCAQHVGHRSFKWFD